MAKIKVTKKELPFLKRDIDLDEAVLKKLSAEQNRYKTRFKDRLKEAKSVSLKRYTAKIESLSNVKSKTVKELDEEIKEYKTLVKELGGTPASTQQPKSNTTQKPK